MKSYFRYSCGHVLEAPIQTSPRRFPVPYRCPGCVEQDRVKAVEEIHHRFDALGLPQLTGATERIIARAERVRGDFAAYALGLKELHDADAYQKAKNLLSQTTMARSWITLEGVDPDDLDE